MRSATVCRYAAALRSPGDEAFLQSLHLLAGIKVAHRPPQQVCIRQAEPCQLVRDAQHLLLVQDDTVGILQKRRKGRVEVRYGFFAAMAADEGVLQPAGQGTGAIERQGNHQIINALCPDLAQRGTHARTLDLEAADRPPVVYQVSGSWIIVRDGIQHVERGGISLGLGFVDSPGYVANDGEATDAEQIDLQQPQSLDRVEVELCNHDPLGGQLYRDQVGHAPRG